MPGGHQASVLASPLCGGARFSDKKGKRELMIKLRRLA